LGGSSLSGAVVSKRTDGIGKIDSKTSEDVLQQWRETDRNRNGIHAGSKGGKRKRSWVLCKAVGNRRGKGSLRSSNNTKVGRKVRAQRRAHAGGSGKKKKTKKRKWEAKQRMWWREDRSRVKKEKKTWGTGE